MNASDQVRDLLQRLDALESGSVRYRQGVVTATGPLSVTLGGASVPYTNVSALAGSLSVGDVVACVSFGHDLLILGRPNVPLTVPVSALPGAPIDGQEAYLQPAALMAQGVIWHLRYRSSSSSAYKWEFLGGAPLRESPGNVYSQALTGVGVTITGLSITAPRAGVYDIAWDVAMVGGTGSEVRCEARVNGASVFADNVGASENLPNATPGNAVRAILAANAVVTVAAFSNTSTVTIAGRHLTVSPVQLQ